MRDKQIYQATAANSRQYEQDFRTLAAEYSAAQETELAVKHAIAQCLQGIAKVQVESPHQLDADIGRQLKMRAQEEGYLRSQLADFEKSIEETLRQQAGVEQQIREVERRVLENLGKDDGYRQKSAEYQDAIRRRDALKPLYLEIKSECDRKAPAFENNALFSHLARAAYGTDAYRHTGLFRTLDHWIARLCNYPGNQANQTMLLAMRAKNESDWDALNRAIDDLRSGIKILSELAENDSEMKPLLALRSKHEEALAVNKDRANSIHAHLGQYETCTDGRYVKAVQMLTEVLGSASIEDIAEMTRKTESDADDELLSRISTLRKRLDDLAGTHGPLVSAYQKAKQDFDRAKEIERAVRESSFVTSRHQYTGVDLDGLLSGFMLGRMTATDVLGDIKEHRSRVEESSVFYPSSSGNSYGQRRPANDDISFDWGSSKKSGDSGSDFGSSSFSTSSSFGGSSSDSFSTSDSF